MNKRAKKYIRSKKIPILTSDLLHTCKANKNTFKKKVKTQKKEKVGKLLKNTLMLGHKVGCRYE